MNESNFLTEIQQLRMEAQELAKKYLENLFMYNYYQGVVDAYQDVERKLISKRTSSTDQTIEGK